MEKGESSAEESTKATVFSQRKSIRHFNEVFGYVPGSTLQYDTDRSQVMKLKLPALNVGVFGSIGAGKSCLINTIESVLSGEYSDRAGENRLAKEAHKCILEATTAERIKLRVGQKICLVDNRGFPKKCDENIAEEVVKQCGKN
jgi:pantothenate kinase-related protein Tda10